MGAACQRALRVSYTATCAAVQPLAVSVCRHLRGCGRWRRARRCRCAPRPSSRRCSASPGAWRLPHALVATAIAPAADGPAQCSPFRRLHHVTAHRSWAGQTEACVHSKAFVCCVQGTYPQGLRLSGSELLESSLRMYSSQWHGAAVDQWWPYHRTFGSTHIHKGLGSQQRNNSVCGSGIWWDAAVMRSGSIAYKASKAGLTVLSHLDAT